MPAGNTAKVSFFALVIGAFSGPDCYAQEPAELEEIVVTAQRRVERLQDVPISVNVVTAQALASKGIGSSADLQNIIPGLTMQEQGTAVTPFLRGIGGLNADPNNESSVAIYIDGVYIAAPSGINMNLNNLERVEVLKGPQGTLFGRNATGGVVQLITKDPKQTPYVEGSLGYGNYNTAKASFYGTAGLTDKLAVDLAFQGSFQGDGWGRNLTTGKQIYRETNYSLRSKVLYTPSDDTTIKIAYDQEYKKNNNVAYLGPDGVVALDGYVFPDGHNYNSREALTSLTSSHPSQPTAAVQQRGFSADISHDFSWARLVSISAFRSLHAQYYQAADNTPANIVELSTGLETQTVSQEVQLLSPASSKVNWVVGYFYFDDNAGYRGVDFNGTFLGGTPTDPGHFLETGIERKRSHAVYAQDTINILPSLKFTTGIRFTHNRSRAKWTNVCFTPGPCTSQLPAVPDIGYDKLTWRVAFDQRITQDIHAYVSYNRGVNGGAFNLLSPGDIGFKPEVLDAYEVGVKSELLNHRLRLNAALFKYYYDNIQVQIVPGGAAAVVQTINAGKAQLEGLDLDFQAVPVRNLTVSGGLTWIHARYKQFPNAAVYGQNGGAFTIDASGQRMLRTPTFTANFGTEYKIETAVGNFPLSLNYSYNSGYAYEPADRLRQQAYWLLNLSAGWDSPDGHWGVYLWGNNVTNAYYFSTAVSVGTGDVAVPAAPATYGIIIKTRWGG